MVECQYFVRDIRLHWYVKCLLLCAAWHVRVYTHSIALCFVLEAVAWHVRVFTHSVATTERAPDQTRHTQYGNLATLYHTQ